MEPRDLPQTARPRRPFPLRLLSWVFVFWGLLGWLRLIRTILERELVLELLSPAVFGYLIVAGWVWGLAGLPVIWGILRGAPWAPPLTWGAAVLFPAIYWFERLALWRDPTAQGNAPFMLLLTLLWFGLVVWALRSERSQAYFGSERKG